jgi:hypothetical protein
MAREEAAKLVEDHALIESANQRAQTIIERSQREAEAMRLEADEYAREVLVSLDSQLETMDDQIAVLLQTVRNGLLSLSKAQEQGTEAEE